MKVACIIPCYNTERTIGYVVSESKRFCDRVIVVDNNCRDATVQEAFKKGAIIYHQPMQGQGAATRKAWNKIVAHNFFDVIVTLDGDGQHAPEEIPKLLKPIKDGVADIVIGCRFLEDIGIEKLKQMDMIKVPRYRRFGIWVITTLFNIGHKPLSDSQSCFRAFNKKAVEYLTIEDNGFGFSTEMLVKARKLGLRIAEVPVSCVYHSKLQNNSTMNPIKHGLSVAFRTIYWRLKLWN